MSTRSRLTRFAAAAVSLAVGAVVLTVASSSAAPVTKDSPEAIDSGKAKPTIVLVHGAFADTSSWSGVIERLQRRGYPVIAPAVPLRGVAGDAAYTRALLDSITGPIVLVGHSYGGQVITNAALNDPQVKALVSIAGFLPDEGESAQELSEKFPGSTLGETLQEVPLPGGGTDLYIRQELFPGQFAADVPLKEARVLAAEQRPISAAALGEPSGPPAWKTIPTWTLIPDGDKNIPPAAQRFMAKRAHAHTEEVHASHLAPVSRPDKVADVIIEAASATAHR
jgi:pimeloyl-ACP methyl ester carboxylesterase